MDYAAGVVWEATKIILIHFYSIMNHDAFLSGLSRWQVLSYASSQAQSAFYTMSDIFKKNLRKLWGHLIEIVSHI